MNECRTKEVLEVMIKNETVLIAKLEADKGTFKDVQLTQQLTDAYWRRRNWMSATPEEPIRKST